MEEKRKSKRQPFNRYAKLQLSGGSLPRDCLVTETSESGLLPEQFAVLLAFAGGNPELQRCRVIWPLGHERWEPSSLTFLTAANAKTDSR